RRGALRSAGVDREGVDAAWHQGLQGIIYEAMPLDAAKAFEAPARDGDAEVAPFARAGVAGVEVAVVDDGEGDGRERIAQGGLDLRGRDAHRESGPLAEADDAFAGSAGLASSSCMKRE